MSGTIFERDLDPGPANRGPLTPLTFLKRAVRAYPEHCAIIHGDQRISYAGFDARCRRLASQLAALGVGRGDTVAMLAPNIPAALDALYAVPMLGAVLNMINTRLDAETVRFMLDHGEAKVFLTDTEYAATSGPATTGLAREIAVVDIDDPLGAGGERLGQLDYDALLAAGDPGFEGEGIEDEWDAISLNYTSGTTGDPKGVVFHHRGAYISALSNALHVGMTRNCVYLWTLPLFHCNGWTMGWVVTAMAGTHVCLRKVDAGDIFRLIDDHSVTHMAGAPVVLNTLVNAPAELRRRTSHAVEFTTGGAAPPAAVIEKCDSLGFTIAHAYGLTETYGPATTCAWHNEWDMLDAGERARVMARQGVPNLSVDDVIVADPETLEPVPADGETTGEIMMRGHSIMKGYLKNPATTKASFAGGWYRSGDIAVLHPDGYIEIKDRSKDIIISGGENISSLEVEDVLYRHAAVLEAAVVAKEDEKWGEIPVAFVTLKDGVATPGADELIEWCRERMAHYKAPRRVEFGALPKTATGKIQKFVLREQAAAL